METTEKHRDINSVQLCAFFVHLCVTFKLLIPEGLNLSPLIPVLIGIDYGMNELHASYPIMHCREFF